jgi:hypothetical protein
MEREMLPGVDESFGCQTGRIFGKVTEALRRALPRYGLSSGGFPELCVVVNASGQN